MLVSNLHAIICMILQNVGDKYNTKTVPFLAICKTHVVFTHLENMADCSDVLNTPQDSN